MKAKLLTLCILALASCSKEKTGPEKLLPPVPELESLSAGRAVVKWDAVEGAASYEMIINSRTTMPATGTSMALDGLEPGTYYMLRMRSVAPEGSDRWMDSVYGMALKFTTPVVRALDTPKVTVDARGADFVEISWNPVKNAAVYVYSVDGAEPGDAEGCSLRLEGLSPGSSYSFRVKAVPGADGQWNDSAWAETDLTTTAPASLVAPVLTLSALSGTGFTVCWGAVEAAAAYGVSLDGGPSERTSGTSAAFGGLSEGSSHEVAVVALPEDGKGLAPSAPSRITVVTRGAAPGGSAQGSTDSYIVEED